MKGFDRDEAKIGLNVPKGRGYKQLSDEEYREKWSRDLCFACDEHYIVEHVCKNKQFKFMLIEEELDQGVD